MKLYIKQKVFSWTDTFNVKDELENDKYFVKGEFLTFLKKLHIYDESSQRIASIIQRFSLFLPKYELYIKERLVATIYKELSFFKPRYRIEKTDNIGGNTLQVEGEFLAHDYKVFDEVRELFSIRKAWLTWGDSYEISFVNKEDEVLALGIVLAIDCATEPSGNGAHQ